MVEAKGKVCRCNRVLSQPQSRCPSGATVATSLRSRPLVQTSRAAEKLK